MKDYFRRKHSDVKSTGKRIRKLRRVQIRSLGPMAVEKAQNTSVVRLTNFLSPRERANVLKVVGGSCLPMYTSNYDEDVDKNGNPIHTTMYLNTDNFFETSLPWLHNRIKKLALELNRSQKWLLNTNSFNVRVAEYHEMFPGGSLRYPMHYDLGSLITVDIMLQEATSGAVFRTLEHAEAVSDANVLDGSVVTCRTVGGQAPDAPPETSVTSNGANTWYSSTGTKGRLQEHEFHAGDALVFVSHKYHCVSQLLAGCRKVLVVEFWAGPRRSCGHRCECDDAAVLGNCGFADQGHNSYDSGSNSGSDSVGHEDEKEGKEEEQEEEFVDRCSSDAMVKS
jgi:hypothetical protein